MVFPRMHFDPVDHKYIYIALRNQISRVAVTQCGLYSTLRDCRAALDPSCGWCVATHKCCTLDECSKSTWISIPEDSFQKELISFQVAKASTEVTLNLHLRVQGTEKLSFACTFKAGNVNLFKSTAVSFPNCSCSLSSHHLPPEGLRVTVTVTIEDQKITETLKLRSCPDITETSPYAQCVACVSAGCQWSVSSKKCSWTTGSATQVARLYSIQDACEGLYSEKYTPEIISLQPNQVSFHGKNNAIIQGNNLEQVMKIRFQGFMECTTKETPVLERSSDTLKFSVPSGNKGNTRVCLVTADGRCHSNATITYGSHPTCIGLQPRNTWASGGRKIEVLGNNLKYMDKIIVNNKELNVESSTVGVWFHSPPLLRSGPFSVSLRVGSSTVDCVDKLSYLPNPEFLSFSAAQDVSYVLVLINKKQDRLNMRVEDVKVWGLQEEKEFECIIDKIMSVALICKILGTPDVKIQVESLRISIGDFSTILELDGRHTNSFFCVQDSP
ncbi:plexin-C1-like [Colossoma macropomum]|uniref:plexin-C1-like n=1 Tax=Colossoma macropomum TaxID=42526 RepID=UPI0018655DEF|nr:plexin-C1-like [Colossoma macropomum]